MAFRDTIDSGWRNRAGARLKCWFSTRSTRELDQDLAAGADPNRDKVLFARARLLISQRAALASSLERYLTEAQKPPGERWAPVPVRWDAILSAAPPLRDLVRRLGSAGPVSPQGVARTKLLLTDGTGPLFGSPGEAGVWTAARAAVLAFDWGPRLGRTEPPWSEPPPPAGAETRAGGGSAC
jgi:hypothetical protein